VAAAKQEVAGHANQGGRAKPHSSHLVGPNVVLFGVGRSTKWDQKNDQTGQQE
jgi:hypothetical protein